jgi:hypothetical protein
MSRSQRSTAMRLGNRHASAAGTSRRVWGSHTALAAVHSNHVRPRHRMLITPGPERRKKIAKNRSRDAFVS